MPGDIRAAKPTVRVVMTRFGMSEVPARIAQKKS